MIGNYAAGLGKTAKKSPARQRGFDQYIHDTCRDTQHTMETMSSCRCLVCCHETRRWGVAQMHTQEMANIKLNVNKLLFLLEHVQLRVQHDHNEL